MKKILSHTQWLAAFLAAALLFFCSGPALRLIDPTAGVFDGGFIQAPVVAATYLFLGVGLAFLILQVAFPTLDDWIDRGGFKSAWSEMVLQQPRFAILYTTAILLFVFVSYLVLLALIIR